MELTSIIRNFYEGLTCRVVYGNQLTDVFLLNTGMRQGYLLSPLLFLLVIDWVIKTFKAQKQNDKQWTQLDHLDFAEDLALLWHNQKQMQEKTSTVVETKRR